MAKRVGIQPFGGGKFDKPMLTSLRRPPRCLTRFDIRWRWTIFYLSLLTVVAASCFAASVWTSSGGNFVYGALWVAAGMAVGGAANNEINTMQVDHGKLPRRIQWTLADAIFVVIVGITWKYVVAWGQAAGFWQYALLVWIPVCFFLLLLNLFGAKKT